jgi:LPXTG-site transpeptidase (sortase) family protein
MKYIVRWSLKLAFAALIIAIIVEPGVAQVEAESAQKVHTEVNTSAAALATAIADAKAREPKVVLVKNKPYQYALTIPKLKINVGVLAMGIDAQDGRMAVPDNYTEVGWYKLGTKPGQVGSAVMGAHVDDGGNTKGVFKNLKSLKVGDSIYVTEPSGNILHYKVSARKVYNYKTPVTTEVFSQKDKARLNLITCHGKWLPKENTYDSRLVVFAELQPNKVAVVK